MGHKLSVNPTGWKVVEFTWKALSKVPAIEYLDPMLMWARAIWIPLMLAIVGLASMFSADELERIQDCSDEPQSEPC